MTYDPEQSVTLCDAPGCRFRLYSMGRHTERRWAEAGGTVLPDGRHACPRHATTPRSDQP